MTIGRSSSIHLGLLLHNHQPVGNFPWVFQQVYEEAYLPMIVALERHPAVRLSLHYTGSLLDWLEEAHPEFLECIAAMVKRNQIEIVSGGVDVGKDGASAQPADSPGRGEESKRRHDHFVIRPHAQSLQSQLQGIRP